MTISGIILIIIGIIGFLLLQKKGTSVKLITGAIAVIGIILLIIGMTSSTKSSDETASPSTTSTSSQELKQSKEDQVKNKAKLKETVRLDDLELATEQEDAQKEDKSTYDAKTNYEELTQTPKKYEGQKITLTGEVIQTIEDDEKVQYRLAVDGDYDKMILLEIKKSEVSTPVAEEDNVTVYGTFLGMVSYNSTLGEKISIPAMHVHMLTKN
ncbi:hypothetical protein [uncultured Enterococcus sp.]|uniref:hypothetical protein n=1 Tax=uncultured Enterococcus sp. TaxID=167972 RepID=UPI0025EDA148|nr:hypothetical protein [uncultured Enterococcus sp.]